MDLKDLMHLMHLVPLIQDLILKMMMQLIRYPKSNITKSRKTKPKKLLFKMMDLKLLMVLLLMLILMIMVMRMQMMMNQQTQFSTKKRLRVRSNQRKLKIQRKHLILTQMRLQMKVAQKVMKEKKEKMVKNLDLIQKEKMKILH